MIVIVLPDIPSEDELLARARRGDKSAVMEIYEAYFSPVYQYLRLRVDDRMLAEDLASEVFMNLILALHSGSAPRYSLRGWLFRVARNLLHEHYGAARMLPTVTLDDTLDDWISAPQGEQPEVQFVRIADAELVRAALRRLAAEQQEVLVLRFGQMLSLQATADIMGKSVSAIKSLQFRAVDNLKKLLADSGAVP